MEFSDALKENLEKLILKADELRDRADAIRNAGGNAQVTVDMLLETCDEIGKLNDALKNELGH